MKRLRRVKGAPRAMMAMPETATDVKRNVVIPPRTDAGIATRDAANLVRIPPSIRNMLFGLPLVSIVSSM